MVFGYSNTLKLISSYYELSEGCYEQFEELFDFLQVKFFR